MRMRLPHLLSFLALAVTAGCSSAPQGDAGAGAPPSQAPLPEIEAPPPGDDANIPARWFPYTDGGKAGYIDRRGNVVIEPRFDYADDFVDGLARVDTNRTVEFLDAQGHTAFRAPPCDTLKDFSDGLAAYVVNGVCGYLDHQGKVVVPPTYDDAGSFSEGLAPVNVGAVLQRNPYPMPSRKVGGKWGFIDRTGRLAIKPQFDGVDDSGFSDGLALVQADNKWLYIDKTGKAVITLDRETGRVRRTVLEAHDFSEGRALIEVLREHSGDRRSGFIAKTGEFAVQPTYAEAQSFSEGLAAVRVDRRWGYVDRAGHLVIAPRFAKARDFTEGLAAVRLGTYYWSYINKQGKVVIVGRFNEALSFSGGLARVHEGGMLRPMRHHPPYWSNGAWFYINRQGNKVYRYREDPGELPERLW